MPEIHLIRHGHDGDGFRGGWSQYGLTVQGRAQARGERSGVEGRRFFRKGNPRTHHVHVVVRGGELWESYLLFRDYMRSHPEDGARYGALKRELATTFASERPRYTESKSPFVAEILEKARKGR